MFRSIAALFPRPLPRLRSLFGVRTGAGTCVAACLALLLPAALGAQDVLGHLPRSSPYHDVESPHELSVIGGYLVLARDAAGVAPRSSPVVGIREVLHLGGPLIFFARVTHTFSDRTVLDPAFPRALRVLGTTSDPLTIADVNFGLNLTGDRSWHYLVPMISAGIGAVSDLGKSRDVGGYTFGTSLAIPFGGGIRWVPPGRFSAHVDAYDYIWRYKYPSSYHTVAIDNSSVIPPAHSLSGYRTNGMFTLGVSYAILH